MARLGDLTFVATTTGKSGFIPTPLDQIPDDVAKDAEEVYEALKGQPNGRIRVRFDTKKEADDYAQLLRSYCEQRPDGEIRFRRSPTRGLPDGVMDFRIVDKATEDAEAAERAANAESIPLKHVAKAK